MEQMDAGDILEDNTSLRWMEEAIAEAGHALRDGEVPIGAVIVIDDKIISRAHNEIEGRKDATAHAEILAIQRASLELGNWRLNDASIYVTVEPCPMCIGALILSRIKNLYFGCYDPKLGAVGSQFDLSAMPELPHQINVFPEVLGEDAAGLLKNFFENRRKGV